MSQTSKYFVLILDFILLATLLIGSPFEDPLVNKAFSILIFVAILWLSEAIPIAIAALCIPILAVILGLMQTKTALLSFADPNIFLFFGGFVIAAAMHRQKIDIFIAQKIILLARGHLRRSIFALFASTAALSMWMSNTAVVAMILPLAIGLLSSFCSTQDRKTYAFVLLGVAFSASIGGLGTIVGTPPNAIVAAELHLGFVEWMQYGLPIVFLFLPLMILVLWLVFRPKLDFHLVLQLENPRLQPKQWLTLFVFITVALTWVFSQSINECLSLILQLEGKISHFDSLIALCAAVVICSLNILDWKEVQTNTDWGILLLFGGGITLSVLLRDSGASKVMADWLVSFVQGAPLFVLCCAVALFVVFLTEVTSNTASAALLVPLFISIADSLAVPSLGLALIVGIGASLAFMLPVATPPNAIVFGSGYIRQGDMMRVGLILNLLLAFLLALIGYVFWF